MPINKGDLVNFHTSNLAWKKEYRARNPGLVVASQSPNGKHYDKGHAYILWSDGTMTREHMSYLEGIK
tara:strand:- start:1176 stop:1379 length:204 start_codon:yes stop_codon:yes gene_type:complete